MDLTVLIIDDSESDRVLIQSHLKRSGKAAVILEAESGRSALDILKAGGNIDCVFLDYCLPDMDGIAVLREVYDESTNLPPFPTVMLTGLGSESIAIEAIRCGAQDYLMKDYISAEALYIAMVKAREVFELKRARNESRKLLEHSQKMQAIGQLTGGIAHEFNNLLTIIFGNLRLVADALDQKDPDLGFCRKKLSDIHRATQRGGALVKRLMVFSSQRKLEPERVDLNRLAGEMEGLLRQTLGTETDIELRIAGECAINADAGQLELAILNMANNAKEAMPGGGMLSVQAENTTLDEKQAAALNLAPGPYIRLTLADTGTGMSKETAKRVFEPFFTTKDASKNAGLGLSMVYGFVKDSGGAIAVESAPGKGAAFHLYFPPYESAAAEKNAGPAAGGRETILLVEDEEDIRFLACAMLKDEGYKVLEAADGHEALAVLRDSSETVDLLFTDIVMPGGLNGIETARQAAALRPGIKLLLTTGYGGGAASGPELAERYPILDKPYQPEDLVSKVREVLHG